MNPPRKHVDHKAWLLGNEMMVGSPLGAAVWGRYAYLMAVTMRKHTHTLGD